uniref:Ysc84 actin-binding domain-containing protein n=1 Tax=Melanopsichium pennsylvanicum 4 TaxID=1398559 RepID=A0A077R1X2_9BASI|nr:conserved hypothetical protein [Melanopsichium pennsylvanicum 4]
MSPNPPPPPPRNAAASASTSSSSDAEASRWTRWGKTAFNKSIVVSDWASGYANSASAKIGGERFWPKSNDFPEEIAKCERILRAFTVEGIETKPSPSSSPSTSPNAELEHDNSVDEKQKKKQESFIHKKRKVLRKIPPAVIKRAKGIVIYTAMRSGIAPLGGAGGAGLMLARLPDGSWSAPSAISPNNIAVGLLLGFDIFDVILIVNTEQAMESFKSHKVTLGAETAVAAGPFGTGISAEMGIDRIPVFSYVRSRGLYGGVEAMAQAFLHRFDENERIYYWPGVTARDILEGKARKPPLMDPLYRALRDAETGIAQGDSLETKIYEVVNAPPNVAVRQLQKEENAQLLQDGERLRLPPTPEELMAMEEAGIPDEIDLELERKVKEEAERRAIEEKKEIMALPPPPTHKKVLSYWESRGTIPGGKRRVAPAPSPLQNKAHVGGGEKEDNEELEVVDLNEAKPSPPERRPQSVESLARELEGSSLDTDGAFEDTYSTDPPSYEHTSPPTSPIYGHAEKSTTITTNSPTSLPDGVLGQSKSDSEHIPLVVIEPVTQTITSTCTHDPLASALPADLNAESLSRTSSLDRPSRPPRRGVPPHSPLLATATNTQTSDFETPKPKLKLFFDWDETVTTHDTLSLIAPPEGNQLDGPSFSYYKQEYVSDLSKFEETFGTKETWDQQLAFLVAIDSVEMASLNRVEQGGLFRVGVVNLFALQFELEH